MKHAETILKSAHIFTATKTGVFPGYIAISEGIILSIGLELDERLVGPETRIIELRDQLICPGFIDVHCFFSGYAMDFVGMDLSGRQTSQAIHAAINDYVATTAGNRLILGHGLDVSLIQSDALNHINEEFPNKPVILFSKGVENCWLNDADKDQYQFDKHQCYPEAYWRLMKDIFKDHTFMVSQFKKYMNFMNSRGITSVKEMGFDDYYGFVDILKQLEEDDELTLRVNFMSQPVGEPINIEFGKRMRAKITGNFVRFSGYNMMTDGSISQLMGDLNEPYQSNPDIHCLEKVNYDGIAEDVWEADRNGFRFSLHAQGDRAVAQTINIFEKCQRNPDGTLVNRHCITDLELTDPEDLARMGKLKIVAEIYPQISSLYPYDEKVELTERLVGKNRAKNYWNRRKMADENVKISCATDLPLLFDDIPESIYNSCGGYFNEGDKPFNPENTLTIAELLTSWTAGGAYNLHCEDYLGTLEEGKAADITILESNVFNTDMKRMRDVQVSMTIVNGKIVYTK
ncbi:MAG: amidohydrolase family protein [Bacillus sp. (in: Bacteria)]|nr:amidohydrolase family protein [Bacillus sp. (in: firmicutes)]